jgi:hypothetical protein
MLRKLLKRLIVGYIISQVIPVFSLILFPILAMLPGDPIPTISELRRMTREFYGNPGVPGDPNADLPHPDQNPVPVPESRTKTYLLAGAEVLIIGVTVCIGVHIGIQTGVLSTENIRAAGKDLWENAGRWVGRQ